jgi:DNA polymerase III subunit epsilon
VVPDVNRYAVIDFETTGFSPRRGARAIEVAAVLIEGGRIIDSYQSLINPGVVIPPFIEEYTGISNAMVRSAPTSDVVMREVHGFARNAIAVAHCARFDRRFWDHESSSRGLPPLGEWVCTMRLSRHLYPEAPNHKLATLAAFHGLVAQQHHRALADASVTAHLFLKCLRGCGRGARILPERLIRLALLTRGPVHRDYRPGVSRIPASTTRSRPRKRGPGCWRSTARPRRRRNRLRHKPGGVGAEIAIPGV